MKAYLETQLQNVLSTLEGVPDDFELEFQTPANPDHGDLATNTALKLARHLRQKPRHIAMQLAERLYAQGLDPKRVEAVEVAGPGFLNFRYATAYLTNGLQAVLDADAHYGRGTLGQGQRALVEFVSANPTGPLTVGHGRNAVLGDTVANLLEWIGYEVTREYYFNNAGRQMTMLGQSVQARYRAAVIPDEPHKTITLDDGTSHTVPATFPYNDPKDHGYLGDYITDIARTLADTHGEDLLNAPDETVFKEAAEAAIFKEIEATLHRLNIHMDAYFNEHSLYEDESIWQVVDALRAQELVYEKEGAVWLKTTTFGKDADTVLVKSTGEPTYRLPDVAYHLNKLDRGFDQIIDVFGADHIATYPDVINALQALGRPVDHIDVIIYQFVTLVRSGKPVKMSTRKATYVTLDELMDEVGDDVTRFFFLMRSPNTHLEFDLDLAKEASAKNPVFYLQYAHARICSIMRKVEAVDMAVGTAPDLDLLTHEAEVDLMKVLGQFPEAVERAAVAREPHRLANFLRDVAVAFSQFFEQCRIVGEAQDLATARLALAQATRIVLRNGLTVLGISAPDRM